MTAKNTKKALLLAVIAALAACSGGTDARLGRGPDGGSNLDGGSSSDAAAPDASTFLCSDDSETEPNDVIAEAFLLTAPVAELSLALCPARDKDYYRFDLTQLGDLWVQVAHDASRGDFQMTLRDDTDTVLMYATPAAVAVPGQIELTATGLAVGSYYIEVRATAPQTDVTDNYRLAFDQS